MRAIDVQTKQYFAKNANIQFLRGCAIIMVLAFHSEPDLFSLGYLGVDVFFVISGWLMAPRIREILLAKTNPHEMLSLLRHYIYKRTMRIYPALLASLIFTVPIVALGMNVGSDLGRAFKQALIALLQLANFSSPKLAGDYFSPSPNPYLHLWSLSIEMQLYVLIPMSLVIFVTVFRKRKFFDFTLPILLFWLFLFSVVLTIVSWSSYYSTTLRAIQFLLGMMFWFYVTDKLSTVQNVKNSRIVGSLTFLLMIIFPLFQLIVSRIHMLPHVLSAMITAIFLVLSTRTFQAPKRLEITNPVTEMVRWFGNISFPLYLVHFPILVMVKHSTLQIFAFRERRDIVTILAVIVSTISAHIIHEKFEYTRGIKIVNLFKKAIVAICVLSFLVFVNANKFFGFNSHLEKPGKSGDRIYFGCDLNEVKSEPCTFGKDTASKKMVLIGDSHAVVLVEAVVNEFKEDFKIDIWTGSGCKYLNSKLLGKLGNVQFQDGDDCQLRNKSFESKLKSERYDYILIAGRSQNCEYNDFYGICGDIYHQSVLDSLIKLNRFAEEVLFLGPSLELRRDTDFFLDRSILGEFRRPKSDYKLSELDPQALRDLEVMTETKLKFYSPIRLFCNDVSCRLLVQNKYVLSDTNHLSRFGATIVARELKKILD